MPKLLVVDDDHAVQEMLIDALRAAGYEVAGAKDGKQAFAELSTRAYELVLLDVLVPRMNGFSLVDELRRSPVLRELPVILMSGIYKSKNHRAEMTTRYGVIEYLDKPLRLPLLLDLVARTVGPGDAARAARSTSRDVERPVVLDNVKRGPNGTMIEVDESLVDSAAKQERREVERSARRDFQTSAFVLQGDLETTPVAAILGRCWRTRDSGALFLRSGKVKKIVYLDKGQPVFVKSNLASECLGQILVRERLISAQDCAASIDAMKQSGRRQGEILVEMRCITEKNLTFALELQLETKLFDTFTWRRGEYRFSISAEVPTSAVKVAPAPQLVAQGIRRSFDETRLRDYMVPILDVPLALRDGPLALDVLELTDAERQALLALRLPATTRQLLDSLDLLPPDSLRLLYTLIALEQLAAAR